MTNSQTEVSSLNLLEWDPLVSFGPLLPVNHRSRGIREVSQNGFFLKFSGEDSVIFSQGKHFSTEKNKPSRKRAAFGGVDCFFVEVFFWFGKVKILGRLASHSTAMMLSSSLLLQLLDDIILTSELFFFEKYCKSF